MRYKENWEQTKAKYMAYWARENDDRPLLNISAPRGKRPHWPSSGMRGDPRAYWTDTERIIRESRAWMEGTYFAAESFPAISPNLGPDIFGACFGADMIFEETTSYSVPFIDDWRKCPPLTIRDDNEWWREIRRMTRDVAADARGDYLVGITDIHSGIDGLVSIRGPANLCMDFLDCPDEVKRRADEVFAAYGPFTQELYDIIGPQDGCTSWFSVWHPNLWYPTSCDFICMISTTMFRDIVLPQIVAEARFLGGRTLFHLDGPGALRHLDALLEVPEIAGIQWVYGSGAPSAAHWIPVLKRIQDAGKCVHVGIRPEEIDIPAFVKVLSEIGLPELKKEYAPEAIAIIEAIIAAK